MDNVRGEGSFDLNTENTYREVHVYVLEVKQDSEEHAAR